MDGEWYRQPAVDRVACCDCGLVHDVEWSLTRKMGERPVMMTKHTRNEKATAQVRRGMLRRGEL